MGGPSTPAPMHIDVPFHLNPIRELEWMIRALVYSGDIKYPSGRWRTRSTSTRLTYPLGDSRREGGSLREEAVPRVGAQLGPRARFGQVDHTAEGEEADRGGRDRGEGQRPGGQHLGRDGRGHRGAPRDEGDVARELHGRPPLPEEGARGLHEQTDVRHGQGPWYLWALRELGLEHYHGTFGDRRPRST